MFPSLVPRWWRGPSTITLLLLLVGCGQGSPSASEGSAAGGAAVAAKVGTNIGDIAPDWTLKDPSGKSHSLRDYRGKVVVMDFWATWCGPCRRAMPGLQKLHEEYADRDVVVMGLNDEGRGRADPVAFMQANGYTYTLLLHAAPVNKAYNVKGIPTFYVIGVDGIILHRQTGFSPPAEAHLVAVVTQHLDEHDM